MKDLYAFLKSLQACPEALQEYQGSAGISFSEERFESYWQRCQRGDWMLWLAARVGYDRDYVSQVLAKCTTNIDGEIDITKYTAPAAAIMCRTLCQLATELSDYGFMAGIPQTDSGYMSHVQQAEIVRASIPWKDLWAKVKEIV